jgi:DNA-binding transcriptional regulator YdaS (Cro superfamily)
MATTWSDAFRSYIEKRFEECPQKSAADALHVAPSAVNYWCKGSRARESTRIRIARWSKGAVPADLPSR